MIYIYMMCDIICNVPIQRLRCVAAGCGGRVGNAGKWRDKRKDWRAWGRGLFFLFRIFVAVGSHTREGQEEEG